MPVRLSWQGWHALREGGQSWALFGLLPFVTCLYYSFHSSIEDTAHRSHPKHAQIRKLLVKYLLPWSSISILKWRNKKQSKLKRNTYFIFLKRAYLLQSLIAALQALEFFMEFLNLQFIRILHLSHWDSVSAKTLITTQPLNKETATLMESSVCIFSLLTSLVRYPLFPNVSRQFQFPVDSARTAMKYKDPTVRSYSIFHILFF